MKLCIYIVLLLNKTKQAKHPEAEEGKRLWNYKLYNISVLFQMPTLILK